MHCFTGDWPMAQQAIELNFHISFSGIVTSGAQPFLQEVARRMPLERMLGNRLSVSRTGAASRQAQPAGLCAPHGGMYRRIAR
jgi:hypothetical protein